MYATFYPWSASSIEATATDNFREGNGRTGTLLLHTVAALCGRRLDLKTVTRGEWYAASRDSTPLRRDGRAHHRPLIPLFVRAMR
jgi:cell filamentation protein